MTITSADLTVAADSSKIPADVKSKLNALISSSDDVPSSVSDLLNGDTKVSHTWKLANYLDDIAAAGQKVDVIVVERDGQWYTSVIGTIAQHVYEAAVHELEGSGRSLAQPDWNLYANPPAAITASSPEAVATNLADALNAHSIQQLLQNLPQDEVRVLYPFVGLLQEAAESGGVDESTGQFTGMHAITVGTEGNLVHVIYDKGTITINDSGEQNVASVDNGCYAADGDQTCFAQWPPFAQTLAKVFGVDKGIPLTLRNVDGGYQLDPIASVTGLVASAVAHVDQVMDALDQFIDFVGQQFAQYGQGFAS